MSETNRSRTMLTHERFLEDFKNSERLVNKTLKILDAAGVVCRLPPPLGMAHSHEEHLKNYQKYTDGGDILTEHGRIEVKARGINFTSASDYPYQTIIVDETYQSKRNHIQPLFGYTIWNKAETHMIWVSGKTKTEWKIETFYDRRRGKRCEYWTVAIPLAQWSSIYKWRKILDENNNGH